MREQRAVTVKAPENTRTHGRWTVVAGLCLALAVAAPAAAIAASGQAVPLTDDASGFELWFSIDCGGAGSVNEDIALGGSMGQIASGSPDALADLCATAGFWAPGVAYDTTEVDASDSTEVAIADPTTLGVLDEIPVDRFSLAPVFPNPNHGIAYIAWSVGRESNVRLTVHDVQGREVVLLSNGRLSPGRHVVRWNAASGGRGLSAGVYFVRLETPEGIFTRRLAIVP